MIAQYSCTGDWVFYLEGDEAVHEDEIAVIRAIVERHQGNPRVEALASDYKHFMALQTGCPSVPAGTGASAG